MFAKNDRSKISRRKIKARAPRKKLGKSNRNGREKLENPKRQWSRVRLKGEKIRKTTDSGEKERTKVHKNERPKNSRRKTRERNVER